MPSKGSPVGERFGQLTVVDDLGTFPIGRQPQWHRKVRCLCDCGNETIVVLGALRSGNTRSCGCVHLRHGDSNTRLYSIWGGVNDRCYNPNCKDYPHYGGKGIRSNWHYSYRRFRDWALRWAKANGYDNLDGLTINRLDNNKNYCAENCNWIPLPDQARYRTNTRMLEAFGETKPMWAWAEDPRCVVSYGTLRSRLDLGWPAEKAIQTPATKPGQILAFGERKSIREWIADDRCPEKSYKAIWDRLEDGWSPQLAISTPLSPWTPPTQRQGP